MRRGSFVVVLVIVAVLVAAALAIRAHGGDGFTDWLASLHGRPRR